MVRLKSLRNIFSFGTVIVASVFLLTACEDVNCNPPMKCHNGTESPHAPLHWGWITLITVLCFLTLLMTSLGLFYFVCRRQMCCVTKCQKAEDFATPSNNGCAVLNSAINTGPNSLHISIVDDCVGPSPPHHFPNSNPLQPHYSFHLATKHRSSSFASPLASSNLSSSLSSQMPFYQHAQPMATNDLNAGEDSISLYDDSMLQCLEDATLFPSSLSLPSVFHTIPHHNKPALGLVSTPQTTTEPAVVQSVPHSPSHVES